MTDAGKGWFKRAALLMLNAITDAYHHQGQVVALCRLNGHPAPETDLQD